MLPVEVCVAVEHRTRGRGVSSSVLACSCLFSCAYKCVEICLCRPCILRPV